MRHDTLSILLSQENLKHSSLEAEIFCKDVWI